MKRMLVLAIVALVVVAVAGSAILAYVAMRPQLVPLTVTDGSTVGVIEANFANYTYTNASIIRFFNATTYANRSDGRTSTLTLRLHTSTYYASVLGLVIVEIDAIVQGEFASDLHLNGLNLTCNQTGHSGEYLWGYAAPLWEPGPINVSYDRASGPPTFTPLLVNQTGKGPFYEFLFPVHVQDQNPLGYNQFVGLRTTVTGAFTPAVSVGILLQLIDIPGGVWQ